MPILNKVNFSLENQTFYVNICYINFFFVKNSDPFWPVFQMNVDVWQLNTDRWWKMSTMHDHTDCNDESSRDKGGGADRSWSGRIQNKNIRFKFISAPIFLIAVSRISLLISLEPHFHSAMEIFKNAFVIGLERTMTYLNIWDVFWQNCWQQMPHFTENK